MPNNRVYYPIHEVSIGPYCSASGIPVHGVQSVNVNTTFNLEQVFELGQLDIYDNVEQLPSVEMTLEKFFDGYPLIYHLATRGATSSNLANRTNQRADVFLSIFSDVQSSSSGIPLTQAYCSGMYTNSLTYSFPVQGFMSESVTLVGNDKTWKTSSFFFNGHFDNTDLPAAPSGILKRSNIILGSAAISSIFPTIIPGMTTIAGSGFNVQTAGVNGVHLQDVNVNTNLARQDLYELGRLRPYYRYANFPVAVNCSINITAGGTSPGDLVNVSGDGGNVTNQPIVIKLTDGTTFDLGNKNKLQSVTYTGGNATGGVVTQSWSFQNFNKLDIKNPQTDPEAIA